MMILRGEQDDETTASNDGGGEESSSSLSLSSMVRHTMEDERVVDEERRYIILPYEGTHLSTYMYVLIFLYCTLRCMHTYILLFIFHNNLTNTMSQLHHR